MFEKMKRRRQEFLKRKEAYKEEYKKASKDYEDKRLEQVRKRARLDARRASGCLTDEDRALLAKLDEAKEKRARERQEKMDDMIGYFGG